MTQAELVPEGRRGESDCQTLSVIAFSNIRRCEIKRLLNQLTREKMRGQMMIGVLRRNRYSPTFNWPLSALLATLLLLFAPTSAGVAESKGGPSIAPPNIVILHADDMG